MVRHIYSVLWYLLLPLTLIKCLYHKSYRPYWRERYGCYVDTSYQHNLPVIWLHCVSVGETQAATPLIEKLLHQYPQHQILLTHTTPTGRALSEKKFSDKVIRAYMPYDAPDIVQRFLDHFKPCIGVLIETEIWFNLIHYCKMRHIPLLLLSARLSTQSAMGYRILGNFAYHAMKSLSLIAVQSEYDQARFHKLGVRQTKIMGNLKFDVTPPVTIDNLRQHIGQRKVWLCASTRQGEEELILDALANLSDKTALLILVPRHPERFDTVEKLLRKRGICFALRSHLTEKIMLDKNCSVLLGDSMGEMFYYLAASDVAFIGGSLLPLGGQSPIDALALGKPVLMGPHYSNFTAIVKSAIHMGCIQQVSTAKELSKQVDYLFSHPDACKNMATQAKIFCKQHQGATQRALLHIGQFIPQP